MDQNQNDPTLQQPTCLFTGELLTEQTKFEHTIQQSVGGRIRSKVVSSNHFNEAAGNIVDHKLGQAFAPAFNRLGLSTPSAHKTPSVPAVIVGDEGQYEFSKDGRFARKKILIERDPRTHKPISAVGSDPEKIARIFGGQTKTELVPSPDGTKATIDVPLFDADIEIAALKSILLTFDHLLYPAQDRFTRSPALSAARSLVAEYVLNGKLNNGHYDRIVMGIQYDKLSELQRIRKLVAKPVTPFEHLLLVSANQATRTIDAVWSIAGIDPYGFRLSADWRAGPFTFLVVSGILKETETCIEPLPFDFNCKLSKHLRAKQSGRVTPQQLHAAAEEISVHHRDAWKRAIDHAERNCPDFVCDGVIRMAQVNLQERNDGRIIGGLIRYLELGFEWRRADPANRRAFDEIVDAHIRSADGDLLNEAVQTITERPVKFTCDQWHRLYVGILDALREPLGLPGEIDQGQTVIEITRPKNKKASSS